MKRTRSFLCLLTLSVGVLVCIGCGKEEENPAAATRRATVDAAVREKHGKALDELPEVTLIVISPNNRNIEREFAEAFSLHHALEQGQRVKIDFREISGGGNAILDYLRKQYGLSKEETKTARIDVVWGGGEDNFITMAEEDILQRMEIPKSFREHVPALYGGLAMFDSEGYWAGTAISAFGFLYNKAILDRLGRAHPKTWDDLGKAEYFDLLALADPTQSSSAAAVNEMIVQSGKDWPDGWAKLLDILGNAKKYFDGASGAADAVTSVAPIATCIDFYGAMRVNRYPDQLEYVSPAGQTALTPDPIAILKNPPHPELAQRFVDFVLSRRGQALWALPVGADDGPVYKPLFRTPIRRDVFDSYKGKLLEGISDPFASGQEMKLDLAMRDVRFGLLRHLVRAAALDNRELLKQAKQALIDSDFEASRAKLFYELPPNVRTREQITEVAARLGDETQREKIVTDWAAFFRAKYRKVIDLP
jgi:ABC-type Fe3+ transport system substrate-binding protein